MKSFLDVRQAISEPWHAPIYGFIHLQNPSAIRIQQLYAVTCNVRASMHYCRAPQTLPLQNTFQMYRYHKCRLKLKNRLKH